jgi:hypothetical protein
MKDIDFILGKTQLKRFTGQPSNFWRFIGKKHLIFH